MDKTLQIVVVATVIMMAAAIVMFMVTGKTGGFDQLVDSKTQGASCTINKTQYVRACNCSANPQPQELPGANEIQSESQGCGSWTSGNQCPQLCP